MKIKLFLLLLIIIGFFYRLYGLSENYSFWTDENHVAIFARAILERGKPVLENGYSTGIYQWLQYWLSAVSAKIFGLNEFAIRFPSVIFGVLTIWAVYLLGKELFNKKVGLLSAFLTAFLKIEILWSRQARPYQALQFFYLLGAWFIYKLTKEEKFNWRYFTGFLTCGILASLMHGLGLVILITGFLYLVISHFSWFKKWIWLAIPLGLVFSYIFRIQILSVISSLGKVNNLFYYRVFLTHNYLFLVFLAFIGWLTLFLKDKKVFLLLTVPLIIQGFAASFLLGQPFVRYFYIVFPFLVLLASDGAIETGYWILDIWERKIDIRNWKLDIGKTGTKKDIRNQILDTGGAKTDTGNSKLDIRGKTQYPISSIQYLVSVVLILVVVFSLWKTDKLSLFPKKVYSLNFDMQEIPEVDWKKIYGFVDQKLKQNPDSVLVSNWNDLPVWHLGEGRLDYLLRKPGKVRIEIDPVSGAVMVYSREEFEKIIKEKPAGILVIDSWDDRIPEGVREYAKENLKKELEIDRLYPVQPRLWPVEVYLWGM